MIALLPAAAALASAATLGIADFAGGLAGRRTSLPSVTVGIELCGLAALPLAIWLLPWRWDLAASFLAFAGGALGGVGLILFYRAMTLNLIGIVAPVTGVVAAALPTVVGVVTGDRLHLGQFIGIGAGLIAITLINGGGRGTANAARAGLGLAIVAGVTFGLFFILFHAASSAGVTAFLSGRAGSVFASLCFAFATRVSVVPGRAAWRLIAAGGLADGAGVVLYLFATFHGLLSLSAVLTSFYPGFTILCARIFTRERLTVAQALGAGLAVLAVALIATT